MEIIKKITSATVGCEQKPEQGFVVYGRIMRATPQMSQYGEYIKFGGQFRGVNVVTNAEFSSAVFLCPGISEDQLFSALQSAQETDKQASVEFAMKFSTKADATAARGYVWSAEPLIEPSGDDPLQRLTGQLQSLKKLPAPATPPKA